MQLLVLSFFSKMTISTSVWSAQHPNAGRNIQQFSSAAIDLPALYLCGTYFHKLVQDPLAVVLLNNQLYVQTFVIFKTPINLHQLRKLVNTGTA